jgi:hypothetical protein
MIAVAFVGLVLGFVVVGWRLKQRRDYCLKQASNFAGMESFFRAMEANLLADSPPQRLAFTMDGQTYEASAIAAYYGELTRQYRRVAARPWLSLPRTPPEGDIIVERLSQTTVTAKPSGMRIRQRSSPMPVGESTSR